MRTTLKGGSLRKVENHCSGAFLGREWSWNLEEDTKKTTGRHLTPEESRKRNAI